MMVYDYEQHHLENLVGSVEIVLGVARCLKLFSYII